MKEPLQRAILYIKLGSWLKTWAAPYEKYAVRGETIVPDYRGVILAHIAWKRKINLRA